MLKRSVQKGIFGSQGEANSWTFNKSRRSEHVVQKKRLFEKSLEASRKAARSNPTRASLMTSQCGMTHNSCGCNERQLEVDWFR